VVEWNGEAVSDMDLLLIVGDFHDVPLQGDQLAMCSLWPRI
jgi:hypothetical protein